MASVPSYQDTYRIAVLVRAGWSWSESDSRGGWSHPLADPIVTGQDGLDWRREITRTRSLEEAWFLHEGDAYDRPRSVALSAEGEKGEG